MSFRLSEAQTRFLEYLTNMEPDSHREQLAILRRGLSFPPAEDVNMYRYVAQWVPEADRGSSKEKIYYLVAALYAFHPLKTGQGNFGSHMAQAAGSQQAGQVATERRFSVLLNVHFSDLADYLRQAVSFLKSKEIPVHWQALFEDLLNWDDPRRISQRKWANGFWVYKAPEEPENVLHNRN